MGNRLFFKWYMKQAPLSERNLSLHHYSSLESPWPSFIRPWIWLWSGSDKAHIWHIFSTSWVWGIPASATPSLHQGRGHAEGQGGRCSLKYTLCPTWCDCHSQTVYYSTSNSSPLEIINALSVTVCRVQSAVYNSVPVLMPSCLTHTPQRGSKSNSAPSRYAIKPFAQLQLKWKPTLRQEHWPSVAEFWMLLLQSHGKGRNGRGMSRWTFHSPDQVRKVGWVCLLL